MNSNASNGQAGDDGLQIYTSYESMGLKSDLLQGIRTVSFVMHSSPRRYFS